MNPQEETPIYDALQRYIKNRIVSFDVPGHKQEKGHSALLEAFGEKCLSMDLNSSKPLDNLTHPPLSFAMPKPWRRKLLVQDGLS